jgi:hypothetical protein
MSDDEMQELINRMSKYYKKQKKFLNFKLFELYTSPIEFGLVEVLYLIPLLFALGCWCNYIYETLSALFTYFVFVDNLGAWLVTYSLCVVMLKFFVFFVVPFYLWVLLLPRDNSPYRYKG